MNKICVAGSNGLVGSAVSRNLKSKGLDAIDLTRIQCDLTDGKSVEKFFQSTKPEYVVLAAAKVGGILANSTYPADFIRDNLLIQTNIIDQAAKNGCKKLIFLGSSCIYPNNLVRPITEDDLQLGSLEPTNAAYAVAKIAGIEMCKSYNKQHGLSAICLMPSNVYGPNDNFNPQNSHFIPALLRKFYEAKDTVTMWGNGTALREFIHVDDVAEAVAFSLEHLDGYGIYNVGTGVDHSIKQVVEMMLRVVNKELVVNWDESKPNGTYRKLMDVSKLGNLGWSSKIKLEDGLKSTYDWLVQNYSTIRV